MVIRFRLCSGFLYVNNSFLAPANKVVVVIGNWRKRGQWDEVKLDSLGSRFVLTLANEVPLFCLKSDISLKAEVESV